MKKTISLFFLPFFLVLISALTFPSYAENWKTKDEIISDFKNLCNSNSDARYEVIGYTVNNNPIYVFYFGHGYGKLLIDAVIHGSEWHNTETLLNLAQWLISDNETAQEIRNKLTVALIPIINYDRFNVSRKNANGVDLNRNFQYGWDKAGSTDPDSEHYRGPSALSEPESKALHDFFLEWQPDVYVNIHEYGGTDFRTLKEACKDYQEIYNEYVKVSQEHGVATWDGVNHVGDYGEANEDATVYANSNGFVLEVKSGTPTYQEATQEYPERFKCLCIAVMNLYGSTNPINVREISHALLIIALSFFCLFLFKGGIKSVV